MSRLFRTIPRGGSRLPRTFLLLSALCGPWLPYAGAAQEPADADVPNILVIEDRAGGDETFLSGAKVPLPAKDLPLSAEIVGPELIERVGADNLRDLLQLTTTALSAPSEGGVFDQIILRGFSDTRFFRNGVNDSLGQPPMRSLANIERVEVLKGPYGVLYGLSEPGGSINFVTKRPASVAGTELSVGLGSYSEFAVDFDSTGPVNQRDDLQYRLIASREQADSFRDFVKRDRLFINPSVAWQPGERVTVDASVEYIGDEKLLDPGLIAIDGVFPLPSDRFLGEPGSGAADIRGLTVELSSNVQLSDVWEIELSLTGQRTLLKGDRVEPAEIDEDLEPAFLAREAQSLREKVKSLVGQVEINGVHKLGGDEHYLVAGMEVMAFDENVRILSSDSDDDPFALDPFRPRYGSMRPMLEFERDSEEKTRQFSLYAQDVWRLSDRWRLLLAARYDYIDQSGSDRVFVSRFDNSTDGISPRLGIVYAPSPSWSWFASYSQSIDPNEGLQPDGRPLAPTRGEAIETGIRWEFIQGRLSMDVSVFRIRQTDVTTDAPGNPGFEIQPAQLENVGLDLELRAQPFPWLSLVAKYGYLDSEISKDPLIPDGTPALNVPEHQVNVLGLVSASLRRPDDLSLGLSLGYQSERQGSLEPEELSLKLPSFVRADAFASWRYSDKLSFQLRLENLGDEQYFEGSQSDGLHLTPGAPRSVQGQVRIAF